MAYLLNSGADKEILTAKDELAVQLTSKPEIRRLLGGMLSNQNASHLSPIYLCWNRRFSNVLYNGFDCLSHTGHSYYMCVICSNYYM